MFGEVRKETERERGFPSKRRVTTRGTLQTISFSLGRGTRELQCAVSLRAYAPDQNETRIVLLFFSLRITHINIYRERPTL